MIRTLIVDDEPIARAGLRTLLEGDSDIQIIGECGNGVAALETIRRESPDLVFLDVQMPDIDGFGVLEQLKPNEMPAIVFVTAYDQYAIRAFEVNAVDYLLKPFDRERFTDSLGRAKRYIQHNRVSALSERINSLLRHLGSGAADGSRPYRVDRVLIKDRRRVSFVRQSDIDWIEVQGNYLCLHVGTERHLARDTLTAMLDKLDASTFLRISRSRAVNAEKVKELRPLESGRYCFTLADGTELQSSRRYGNQIEDYFRLA
jgi:two-component system LytT family response regulator